jgi:FK506-binding protein 2
MKASVFVAFIVLITAAFCEEKKASKKLQIGVKKRVENCTLKSKKGDVLHMHYTVRIPI